MNEQLTKIYGYILHYGMDIFSAALIFFIGKWLAGLVTVISEKLMQKAKVDVTLVVFSKNIIYFALLTMVVIAALNKLGVQTTSLVAVIGAAGLAIGLALQGSLSNFAAGVLIIIFRPFGVGDTIETAGSTGVVEEIQIFTTILKSSDKKRIIIPNSKITADKIIVAEK